MCPDIKDQLDQDPSNPGQPVTPCQGGQNGNPTKRQDSGGSCPLVPGDINWQDGPSEPKCEAEDHCGGGECQGYYCDPNPKEPHPPDYYDLKDPDNPHGPTKPDEPDEPDPNNPECGKCSTDMSASLCLPAYHSCLLDECWANSHYKACKFDCDLLYEEAPIPPTLTVPSVLSAAAIWVRATVQPPTISVCLINVWTMRRVITAALTTARSLSRELWWLLQFSVSCNWIMRPN